jgi:hypothetical protein
MVEIDNVLSESPCGDRIWLEYLPFVDGGNFIFGSDARGDAKGAEPVS